MNCDNCKHLHRFSDTVEFWGAMVSMPLQECRLDMEEWDEGGEGCPEYEYWDEREEYYQRVDYEWDKRCDEEERR